MKKIYALALIFNFAAIIPYASAQSEAAVLFLLIQPSLRANGMAGASVASSEHDPLSVAFNPAHVGLATLNRSFQFEFYPSKTNWLPQFNLDDLNFDAKSFLIGYKFKINSRIPASIGAGYTRVFINLGTQNITDETNEIIATFQSSEHADIFSFGIGVDLGLKIGIGFSFKRIESNLASGIGLEVGSGQVTANAYDFGFIAHLPILQSISKLTDKSFKIGQRFQPFILSGFGFSRSNFGDEISYIDAAQADPLPRVARMAVSVNTGIRYLIEDLSFRLVDFEWSSEARDLLVKRSTAGNITYEEGFGKIGFFDNVIAGNSNSGIETNRGWELNILELISLRYGRFEDPGGAVFYDTDGFGLRSTGLFKIAFILNPRLKSNSILSFLGNHVDVQYNTSKFNAGRGHPLDGTKFKGVRVSFF